MDVKSNFATQTYANARVALKPDALPDNKAVLELGGQLGTSFIDVLQQGELTAKAGLLGRADPLSIVEALSATELAFQTVVSVRDKVVEAYQEILRMPV